MLSANTVRLLEGIAQRSNELYQEGGLLYTFTEASNQAHRLFPKQFVGNSADQLNEDDHSQLAIVICKALGNPGCKMADTESLEIADDLTLRFREDLEFSNSCTEEDPTTGYCWGVTVHMMQETTNKYFSLRLWGSID